MAVVGSSEGPASVSVVQADRLAGRPWSSVWPATHETCIKCPKISEQMYVYLGNQCSILMMI